ncbi:F-box only protein 40 [Engraulis encrasicolus]|uniref:F-box only protein 40 n=1 Tax=Engraulis encrasicolus TaxID=184585 RepID=UPI002FD2EF39
MSYYRQFKSSKLHPHCETCYSHRCRAPVEIPDSCAFTSCRLYCGANFHLCREEEHKLLCPNEKVPCLNAQFGCPFTMARCKQAQHLESCPASVVYCSVEWNRWPVEDVNCPFHTNMLKEAKEKWALDLTMAVRDQSKLCERVKMRSLFPELVDPADMPREPSPPPPPPPPPPPEPQVEERGAVGGAPWSPSTPKMNSAEPYADKAQANGGSDYQFGQNGPQEATKEEEEDGKQEDVAVGNAVDGEKYNRFEKMFSMERGACKQIEEEEKDDQKDQKSGNELKAATSDAASASHHAPWERGVLERLREELTAQEYNMYMVHHGRMLMQFGQIEGCTPRDRDFVYGSLEPIPVQSIKSDYHGPTAYTAKRKHKRDITKIPKTETVSTDTSDLGVSEEDIEKMDEMYITLLCCAEKEIRGHEISELQCIDGDFVDMPTQTYSYSSAPFKYNTSLADITAGKELKLYVDILTESISSRYTPNSCVFTFRCGHPFRRDEYGYHYKNLHADIQFSLEGWFEQRCPLAYLGCTHSQRRIHPLTQRSTVCYHQELSTFSLQPELCPSLSSTTSSSSTTTSSSSTTTSSSQARQARRGNDSLSCLPYEVLCHIAGYLDCFTLSSLALVSTLFRDVCSTHLEERGMVMLKWRKKSYKTGGSRWKSTPVWQYSNLFSKVDRWCLGDGPSMADHLKVCPFYQKEVKTGKVAVILKD